jgi:hypothetical protein
LIEGVNEMALHLPNGQQISGDNFFDAPTPKPPKK